MVRMPLQKSWREATEIFLISRLVLFFVTVLSLRFPLAGQTTLRDCAPDSNACVLSWFHWDAIAYTNLAEHGYSGIRDTVFFPLWPLFIHFSAVLFASTTAYYIAGLVLANLCFYFALVVFYRLLSADFDPTVARNALLFICFSPYSLFFFAGYAESLFLLLCLSTFFCLQRSSYWLAGLCGFLAALTRSQGVLLVVPFVVIVIQRFWTSQNVQNWKQKLWACLPIVLIPFGVITYMLYLWSTKGDPLAFSTQEALSWNRHLTFPFMSILFALQTFFTHESMDLHLLNLLDVAFVFASLAIIIIGWKRLPLHYSLFALTVLLFSISYPQGTVEPLTASPRYMLVIFPIFVILGSWSKHPRLSRNILLGSLPFFALNIILFVSHYWVS